MIKTGKIYISLFVFVLGFVCICAGAFEFMLLSYLSLLIHEMFHLIAAVKLKIKVKRIVVLAFGINIETDEKISSASDVILCAMGPFGSLVFALIFMYLKASGITFEGLDYLVFSNLSIFLINIVPIYPLDGGRILKRILESKMGYYRAVNTGIWISQLCVFIMCVFIFTAIILSRFNMSVMTLCCFLIYSLSQQKKAAILSYSKLLIYSNQKLEKNAHMPVREIAAAENTHIKDVLKTFSDSVYIIITVVDKKGKIRQRLSETELIERLSHIGNARFISEII